MKKTRRKNISGKNKKAMEKNRNQIYALDQVEKYDDLLDLILELMEDFPKRWR